MTLAISAADVGMSSVVGQGGVTILSGTPTPNATLVGGGSNAGAFAFSITGTWSGTLNFYRTADGGATWEPASATVAGLGTLAGSITGNGGFALSLAGYNGWMIRASAWVSGSANVAASPDYHQVQDQLAGTPATLVDGADVTQGAKADAAATDGASSWSVVSILKGILTKLLGTVSVNAGSSYASPNSKSVRTNTTLDSLFSDDFGGSAVSATNWDVLDGGLAANANLGSGVLTQAKIGSGTTGITDSVAASGLTVAMGTTLGAERWYLSKQVFAGKEDILVVMSKSQQLTANDIFIGLAEVDPTTLVPLLNPNFAADGNGSMDFTNRGGAQFGLNAAAAGYTAEAVGDSSSAKAVGAGGSAVGNLTSTQEFLIEIDSRDIIVSSAAVDSVSAKGSAAARVSTQCPNDKKLYKLVMRFRNVTTPGSGTSVVIQRILVVDNYELRVQVSTGEGDQIGAKSLGVNINGAASTSQGLGSVCLNNLGVTGSPTTHKLTAGASTNATSVKNVQGCVAGGYLRNRAASERYFKFYNKASAPTVGTDTPILTIGIPATSFVSLADVVGAYGLKFAAGIAYAMTTAYADADTGALTAGDVDVNLIYA